MAPKGSQLRRGSGLTWASPPATPEAPPQRAGAQGNTQNREEDSRPTASLQERGPHPRCPGTSALFIRVHRKLAFNCPKDFTRGRKPNTALGWRRFNSRVLHGANVKLAKLMALMHSGFSGAFPVHSRAAQWTRCSRFPEFAATGGNCSVGQWGEPRGCSWTPLHRGWGHPTLRDPGSPGHTDHGPRIAPRASQPPRRRPSLLPQEPAHRRALVRVRFLH